MGRGDVDIAATDITQNVTWHMRAAVLGGICIRIWLILARFSWVLISIVCLMLSYLLIWHRGFYLDDYSDRLLGWNVVTGHVLPVLSKNRDPIYPARLGTWIIATESAALIPNHEVILRAIATVSVGVDALLLGGLVYRMLGSRVAALVAGWLFLVPVFGFEAVLWPLGYPVTVALALLFLHSCWSAFTITSSLGFTVTGSLESQRLIAVCALSFAIMLSVLEAFVSIIGFVPIFAIIFAARRRPQRYWAALKRAAIIFLFPLLAAAAIYFLMYRTSPIISERGGLDISVSGIIFRCRGFLQTLRWLTISDTQGQPLIREAFRLGYTILFTSWMGITLFILACAFVLFTIITWRPDDREHQPGYRVGFIVLGFGLLWFLVTLLFPAALVNSPYLEYRQLYFPMAGIGIALGALVWLILKWLSHPLWEYAVIALASVILILNSITMIGFASVFAARSQLDQRQIAAVVRSMPSESIPQDSYLLPFNPSTQVPLKEPNAHISGFLDGVFNASWSADGALAVAYRRIDVHTITSNHWVGMQFSDKDGRFLVQGIPVPVERTVLFAYQGDTAAVIEQVTIQHLDGTQHIVRFPVAEALLARGTTSIANLMVIDGVPLFALPVSA